MIEIINDIDRAGETSIRIREFVTETKMMEYTIFLGRRNKK